MRPAAKLTHLVIASFAFELSEERLRLHYFFEECSALGTSPLLPIKKEVFQSFLKSDPACSSLVPCRSALHTYSLLAIVALYTRRDFPANDLVIAVEIGTVEPRLSTMQWVL